CLPIRYELHISIIANKTYCHLKRNYLPLFEQKEYCKNLRRMKHQLIEYKKAFVSVSDNWSGKCVNVFLKQQKH
ncbi:hypothetical protein E2320_002952, partial [Naja naja]